MLPFAASEYRVRLERTREALRADGMAGAICVSPETICYLTAYEGYTHWTPQALVIGVDEDEPTLLLRNVDRALAEESTLLAEVRYYDFEHDDPGFKVGQIVEQRGLASGVIGIEMGTHALTADYHESIVRCVRHASLLDCSLTLSRVRVRKSSAELDYVREAAVMSRVGMAGGIAALRAGVTEFHVASQIETALRHAGSEYSAMPTMVGSGPRSAAMHATPRDRVIEAGDPVLFYFAGVRRRYHVTAYRTAHVGPPSEEFLNMYSAAEETIRALSSGVEVGMPVSATAHEAAATLRKLGQAEHHVARWGYGVGIAYPPVWLEAFDVSETSDDVFQDGTVMCLHVCLVDSLASRGVMVGSDYILGHEGLETLDAVGPGLVVV